jgi:hypothetical protein
VIDAAKARGFAVSVAIADKGCDNEPFHAGCMDRIRLHADLTILAKLATALSRTRSLGVVAAS